MNASIQRDGSRPDGKRWNPRLVRCVLAFLAIAGVAPGLRTEVVLAENDAQLKQHEARIEGKVCNAVGEAIAGATLWLERDVDTRALEVETSADGKYVFVVSGGGRFRLKVMKDGFRDAGVEAIELSEGGIKHVDVTLEKENAQADANAHASGKAMEFSDEPNFTVAGVTDWSNVGLHGSDAHVRTSELLVKDAAALKPGAGTATSAGTTTPGASSEADAHRLLGDAKEKNGDPLAAVKEYERAARLEPSEENYFAWGRELLRHRAGVPAVEVFKKGVEAHPKSARMRAGLGAAYYTDGQFAEAAELMCEASDLNPKDPGPFLLLGKMESASSDVLACSEERLAQFANEHGGNALANYYYGLVLWKKGRKAQSAEEIQRAEVFFKKAIAVDPGFGDAYVQLGIMYNARGEKDAALHSFQKAAAASPKSSAAHYQLSLAYRRAGENEKAEQEMKMYDDLKRAEDAELERERHESVQFVTIHQ